MLISFLSHSTIHHVLQLKQVGIAKDAINPLCLFLKIGYIQKSFQQFNSGKYCQTSYPRNSPDRILRNVKQNVTFLLSIVQLSFHENRKPKTEKEAQSQLLSSLTLHLDVSWQSENQRCIGDKFLALAFYTLGTNSDMKLRYSKDSICETIFRKIKCPSYDNKVAISTFVLSGE